MEDYLNFNSLANNIELWTLSIPVELGTEIDSFCCIPLVVAVINVNKSDEKIAIINHQISTNSEFSSVD